MRGGNGWRGEGEREGERERVRWGEEAVLGLNYLPWDRKSSLKTPCGGEGGEPACRCLSKSTMSWGMPVDQMPCQHCGPDAKTEGPWSEGSSRDPCKDPSKLPQRKSEPHMVPGAKSVYRCSGSQPARLLCSFPPCFPHSWSRPREWGEDEPRERVQQWTTAPIGLATTREGIRRPGPLEFLITAGDDHPTWQIRRSSGKEKINCILIASTMCLVSMPVTYICTCWSLEILSTQRYPQSSLSPKALKIWRGDFWRHPVMLPSSAFLTKSVGEKPGEKASLSIGPQNCVQDHLSGQI